MTNNAEFEGFMRDHQNMVFATAVRLLGNETDAADISQEVFLRAFRHYAEISASDRRAGWLKTVTTNLCLNHLARYRSRWRFFSELLANPGADDDFSATLPAVEPDAPPLACADQQEILQAALLRLSDTQRVPLVLFHFEDLSYQQIADQLGVTIGKVKTDIRRGRETLRKRLNWTAEGELAPSFRAEAIASRPNLMGCI